MACMLFLNAVTGIRAALKPDQGLSLGLFLPPADLCFPIFMGNVIERISQVATHIVLKPLNHGIALTRIKAFVYIIS